MDAITVDDRDAARETAAAEWQVRVDLAACYRLIAHFGWDDLIFTHISARVPGTDREFLMNPMGLAFPEITASRLLKIDLDGHLVEPSEMEPNEAGFIIHSAVYLARPDAQCVLHTHTEANIAVGAQEEGLLPLSQWAMQFYGRVGYHDYEGPSLDLDERTRLQRDLGALPVLVLRNHGLLCVGRNVAEAFSLAYHFERASAAQLKLQAASAAGAKIVTPPPEVCAAASARLSGPDGAPRLTGQREWPAMLRLVERLYPDFRV
jgi:ribulose-5-phosphate 4-epimerase/fuculose-1-phosphate aldolase